MSKFSPFYRGPEVRGSKESARVRGSRAQKAGDQWERLLDQAVQNYRVQGRAHLRRVGAPFKTTRKPTVTKYGLEFHGVFEGEGGCDFVGHIRGVPFEADAKHTSETTRWAFEMLKPHQAESLDDVAEYKGHAGILAQLGTRCFWLPWSRIRERWWAWHNVRKAGAKIKRGGASVSLEDCEKIGVEFHGGDFLCAVLEADDA